MTISNTRYIASHGKAPRGFGWWAFDIEGHGTVFAPCAMALSDAKKWVSRNFPNRFIWVAP